MAAAVATAFHGCLVHPFAVRRITSFASPSSATRSALATLDGVNLSVGTYVIPHPSKAAKGGEDALFVRSYNGGVVAIADGVSGWVEKNVDPALFPNELLKNGHDLVVDEEVNFDPQLLLKKAHASTGSTGSATVIIAMMENNGILKIASVGDCGLKVIRKGRLFFSTLPQEHYFDCPYQISSEKISQTYEDALVCNVQLKEGDILVLGSDGLFDNIFDHEILSVVGNIEEVSAAAKELAELASRHSRDVSFDSPYSIEVRNKGFNIPWWKKMLGGKLTGGKLDDITVIVGLVVRSSADRDDSQVNSELLLSD